MLSALLGAALLPTAQAAPVGMVAHLSGQIAVVEGTKKVPLRLLSRVEAGTLVSGPTSNAIIVLFGSGARFQVGPRARVNVSATRVAGAKEMAALSGPSAGAARLLGNARVGAVLARPASSFQRLLPDSKGYLIGSAPRFDWNPIEGAARYSFTLFDLADNIIWSTSTESSSAEYGAATPLIEKRPYMWKLSGFSAAGKPLMTSRWGIVTLLSSEDASALDEVAATLKNEAQSPSDKSALLLLVETYRSFGVLNSALEVLDSESLRGVAGVAGAKNEILDSLSPFGRALAGRGTNSGANLGTNSGAAR